MQARQEFTLKHLAINPDLSKNSRRFLQAQSINRSTQENFPVARWWMPKHIRESLLAFYQFARGSDDIADSLHLPREQKLQQLQDIRQFLRSKEKQDVPRWLQPYHHLITSGKISAIHGDLLLSAFLQDCSKNRYESWEELMQYCAKSAAPVGRVVLELYREPKPDLRAADALCSALQIINHLQDIRDDYILQNRIYFPISWFDHTEELCLRAASSAVRTALDQALANTKILLKQAQALPASTRNLSLRLMLFLIYFSTERLIQKLSARDPLRRRITLNPIDKAHLTGKALWHWIRTFYAKH